MLKRYFIELAYNGTNYHGWQIQPNAITVQETLQKTLAILLKYEPEIVGCGRTDAGVHARKFFSHLEMDLALLKLDEEQLAYKLNHLLPPDIAIFKIFQVHPEAHTRFDAVSRTYEYRLRLEKYPFERESVYRSMYPRLDFELMNETAKILFDYTDFTSFSKTGTDVKTNNCHLMRAEWEFKEGVWVFTIQADRFLRNMVRAIVGTLLEVGSGKMSPEEFRAVIESKNRNNAGWSVPASGLALTDIAYPDRIYDVK